MFSASAPSREESERPQLARGLRTLVIDLDPQCDATTGLGAIGEFNETCADVLKSPKHNVVHKAIVSS
ncbi:MAG: hypothetical protein RI919_820, partial [Actinomycetota bacterium]